MLLQDQLIQNLQGRFPYHVIAMRHYIESSKHQSTLFLSVYCVTKCEDKNTKGGDTSHKHNDGTKSVQHNHHYYNPQDFMSVTIDNKGRRRHTVNTTRVIENQKV